MSDDTDMAKELEIAKKKLEACEKLISYYIGHAVFSSGVLGKECKYEVKISGKYTESEINLLCKILSTQALALTEESK